MMASLISFQVIYLTHTAYDPEGILGSINTVLMAFLGLQVCSFNHAL